LSFLSLLRKKISSNKSVLTFGFIAFIIPFAFRAGLEYLSGPFLIGWDSVASYDVWLRTGSQLQTQDYLFYFVLSGVNSIARDSTTTIKVTMIGLTGLTALALYCWIVSLGHAPKISALASVLTCLYFPVLRISWDLGRNMLALAFGLPALVLLSRTDKDRNFVIGTLLLIASVFADPIVSPLVVAVVVLGTKLRLAKKVGLVAVAVLSIVFALGFGSIQNTVALNTSTSIGFYLGINAPLFFAYLLGPLIPFAIVSFWKHRAMNRQLLIWTLASLVVSPFITLGYRFILLSFLALIPLIFFSLSKMRYHTIVLPVLTIVILFFGVSYVAYGPQSPFVYYNIDVSYHSLVPASLMLNTLTIPQSRGAIQVLSDNQVLKNCGSSALITTTQFFDYAIRSNVPQCAIHNVGLNYTSVAQTANTLAQNGKQVYLVWYQNYTSEFPGIQNSLEITNASDGIGLFVIH
jgi:hypothetical protein